MQNIRSIELKTRVAEIIGLHQIFAQKNSLIAMKQRFQLKGMVEMHDFRSTKLKIKVTKIIKLHQIVTQENSYENTILLIAVKPRFQLKRITKIHILSLTNASWLDGQINWEQPNNQAYSHQFFFHGSCILHFFCLFSNGFHLFQF